MIGIIQVDQNNKNIASNMYPDFAVSKFLYSLYISLFNILSLSSCWVTALNVDDNKLSTLEG